MPARRESYVASPSVRGSLGALEEDAVVFAAELREVGFCRCGIGFEVEAMPRFPRRRDGHRNRRRTLEEVAAELVCRVTEGHATGYAAPLDSHRVDDGVEDPERVRGVEAVRNVENVEHGADIVYQQLRGSASNVHLSAVNGVGSTPKDERAGRDAWII